MILVEIAEPSQIQLNPGTILGPTLVSQVLIVGKDWHQNSK